MLGSEDRVIDLDLYAHLDLYTHLDHLFFAVHTDNGLRDQPVVRCVGAEREGAHGVVDHAVLTQHRTHLRLKRRIPPIV